MEIRCNILSTWINLKNVYIITIIISVKGRRDIYEQHLFF